MPWKRPLLRILMEVALQLGRALLDQWSKDDGDDNQQIVEDDNERDNPRNP
jgi:hypothetical protein